MTNDEDDPHNTLHDSIKPAGLVRSPRSCQDWIQFGGWAVRATAPSPLGRWLRVIEAGDRSPPSKFGSSAGDQRNIQKTKPDGLNEPPTGLNFSIYTLCPVQYDVFILRQNRKLWTDFEIFSNTDVSGSFLVREWPNEIFNMRENRW